MNFQFPATYTSDSFTERFSDLKSVPWKSASASDKKRLHVILPSLNLAHMSGGPNTVINFCCQLSMQRIAVRFWALNLRLKNSREEFLQHCQNISGGRMNPEFIEIADVATADLSIGPDDHFMASAWWTCYSFKEFLAFHGQKKFFYFIQDFEPGFYNWSSQHALALDTYMWPHIPVVNSFTLAHYMGERFKNFNADLCFEPSVDKKVFYFEKGVHKNKAVKTLLFYARPSAPRNLYELGLEAIYRLAQQGKLNSERWKIYFIGEKIKPIKFDNGVRIDCQPWLDFPNYCTLVRSSDVALSLMLSPHPSYTPLEAAAAGNLVVSNSFLNKTEAYLQSVSSNILACAPTLDSVTTRLGQALDKAENLDDRERGSSLQLPATWYDAFGPIIEGFKTLFHSNGPR